MKKERREAGTSDFGKRTAFDTFFEIDGRVISAFEIRSDKYKIAIYRDEFLRCEEKSGFLAERINYNDKLEAHGKKEGFINIDKDLLESACYFGVTVLRTKHSDKSLEEIYKSHLEKSSDEAWRSYRPRNN
jgi:hypothetical protein